MYCAVDVLGSGGLWGMKTGVLGCVWLVGVVSSHEEYDSKMMDETRGNVNKFDCCTPCKPCCIDLLQNRWLSAADSIRSAVSHMQPQARRCR